LAHERPRRDHAVDIAKLKILHQARKLPAEATTVVIYSLHGGEKSRTDNYFHARVHRTQPHRHFASQRKARTTQAFGIDLGKSVQIVDTAQDIPKAFSH